MFRRVVFSIFCLVPGQLLAGTLYNNLGPGDTFSSGIWEGQNVSLIGLTFTTTGAGTLSTILLPIAAAPNGPPVTFTLYSNSMGAPSSQIESWTGNPPAGNGGEPPLTTLTSVQNPAISSGTQYWFLITQQPGQILWSSSQGVNDGIWTGDSLTSLIQIQIPKAGTAALQVNSSEGLNQVPEPGGAVLLLVGLTWSYLRLRKK